jgi:alkanesulfonate monooxygenase SsuD/methylene tetrahydromethanopterin reductase-like flavin-dependent oxidoreductase (luciferase family)
MKLSLFSVNDHYPDKGRSVPQLYAEVIRQAELGEALGYEIFFSAEHHFHPYGVAPDPSVLLAAIAQRTRRIRVGTAISVLTFHNPLTVAETYAMVDVLSEGRLVLGVGSGYLKHELEGYGVSADDKRARFDENFALVRRLLAGERVTHAGRFAKIDGVQINVLPLQKPVPIYVAVLRKEAAFAVGSQGEALMAVPYASLESFDDVAPLMAEFRRGQRESGRTPALPRGLEDNQICFHTFVAETDAEARKQAEASFDLYVATRLYAKRATYDDIMRNGLHLMGGVETVTNKLIQLKQMGVQHVMTLQNFGALPAAAVERSMRLMMEEVLPRVRGAL